MQIHIHTESRSCVISVGGEIDLYNAPRLKEEVMGVLAQDLLALVVSLKRVTYIDSSGIGALLAINAALTAKSLTFHITDVPAMVMRVLELTRLVNLLPIERSKTNDSSPGRNGPRGMALLKEQHRKSSTEPTRDSHSDH